MSAFSGKRVLVAGGTGLIGRPLVELLVEQGARVRVASLDESSGGLPEVDYRTCNLLEFRECVEACDGMEMVFNLLGVKGSPAAAAERPASFFVPTLILSLNLLEAARQVGVERFLYASSVAVYAPADFLHEDDVWRTFPSPHDRFAGWAKRMGELQAESYRLQYGWNRIAIVRPSNVYGPFDNFDSRNAMVVPSLIRRALSGDDPLVVWGDGSAQRDFIHARDVARGMLLAMDRLPAGPVNLGSGVGVSIREIVEAILGALGRKPQVAWDSSRPTGDRRRIMDISRARSIGFESAIPLEEGIRETIEWYRLNRRESVRRYDVFNSELKEPLLG